MTAIRPFVWGIACWLGITLAACANKGDTGQPATSHQKPTPRVPVNQQAKTVRLFADEIMTRNLPLSLSIETLGGVSTVLIPRGTALPAERRETFSTASDNQNSVEIHPLVGDHAMATDNISLGKFSLTDIPPAPRGVPTLEVVFRVDAKGIFVLSATDTKTGKSQPISVSGSSPQPLAKTAVDKMLAAAKTEEARGDSPSAGSAPEELDSLKVYSDKLRGLIQTTREALKAQTGVSDTARRACETEIEAAEKVLAANDKPERSSEKLRVVKVDAVTAALDALDALGKDCR